VFVDRLTSRRPTACGASNAACQTLGHASAIRSLAIEFGTTCAERLDAPLCCQRKVLPRVRRVRVVETGTVTAAIIAIRSKTCATPKHRQAVAQVSIVRRGH
jgi:hypothetical protein